MKVCKYCGMEWEGVRGTCPECNELLCNVYGAYRPTLEEIREACARIRRTWSTKEENRRRAAAYRCESVDYDLSRSAFASDGRVNRKDTNSYLN